MKVEASAIVTVGIPVIALLVIGLFIVGFVTAGRRLDHASPSLLFVLFGCVAWLAVPGVLAASGVLARFEMRPPPLGLVIGVHVLLAIVLALSPIGRRFAMGLPLAALIGAQAFRLPLEMVMHQAAREGVMPVQMSYSGWNFDIVTGASAIFVSELLAWGRMPRWGVVVWNAMGSLLLATIMGVAIASVPFIRAFGDAPERVNSWVAYFPFVWLATVMVPGAIFGHIVIARRLLAAS